MWRMGYLGRGSELPPHQLGGLGELCKLPQLGTQSFWGHFIAQVYRYCSENTYKRIVYYQLLKLTARPIFSVTSLVRVVLNHWGGVKRPNRPPPPPHGKSNTAGTTCFPVLALTKKVK